MSETIIVKNGRGEVCRHYIESWAIDDTDGNRIVSGIATYAEAAAYRDAEVPGGVVRPG